MAGLTILATVGCSGGEGVDAANSVGVKSSSPAGTPEKSLTAQDLKTLALTADEVPGNRGVDVRDAASESESTFPPVSVKPCQTIIDFIHADGASASVVQVFNWEKDIAGGGSTLAYYGVDEAKRAFQRAREALKRCASYSGANHAGEYTAEVKAGKAPNVGDGAVVFHEATSVKSFDGVESITANTEYVCVRTGGAVAVFNKSGYEKDVTFPRRLIAKQVDRLAKAQR
ncbi:hypothetical protein ABTX62_33570 [Streptomyces sp. NPDC096046]|uniref:hypothetical protein n=1 Tax=Streptomyces sp. NPDC096046 TaxID=3155542 RepID=UPI003317B73E